MVKLPINWTLLQKIKHFQAFEAKKVDKNEWKNSAI